MKHLNIQMVDLKSQYLSMQKEIDDAILSVIHSTQFINGDEVRNFANNLSQYFNDAFVIPCANGTDALQIALMALELEPGDEVLVPAFTYVATAEVIALLGLTPKLVDVDPNTFNITADILKNHISDKTKVIIPVHLFGQSSDMEDILKLAKEYNITVIEDNAQAIGALYTFKDGSHDFTGCMGDMGTTSFFPSKNLGCYGDGGAMTTRDEGFAHKLQMIANHGQSKKYHHQIVGCNSRLDTIQAAVLNVKLKYLDNYALSRQKVANYYNENLVNLDFLSTPLKAENSTHVYHQYTLKIKNNQRDNLKNYLQEHNIPSMVYYPIPLYKQVAFNHLIDKDLYFKNTEELCNSVLSLPIHTEMKSEELDYIVDTIKDFQA